jgi:hypothetical protein
VKQGFKKRKPQQMIPVAMGLQHKIPGDIFFQKKITQAPDSGSGIDNHGLAGSGCDLKAGGISTIGNILPA